MPNDKIIINSEFKSSLKLLEDSKKNIFITGKAGTGKSTLLTHFLKKTKKKVVVLAPTGVAALNVQGETIHSFFKFQVGVNVLEAKKNARRMANKPIFRKLEMIIIDEISMVRADLLDCVDAFLKVALSNSKPFGGIKLVFIGDLYQLPPVVIGFEKEYIEKKYGSAFFFNADVIKKQKSELEIIELIHVYRQKDNKFVDILNSIRKNTITRNEIDILNKNHKTDIENDEGYIYLTTTNRRAEEINVSKLNTLKSKKSNFFAEIEGNFEKKHIPNDIELILKKDAQVMFLNNDSENKWVNGTIGVIEEILDDNIIVKLKNNNSVIVERHSWKLFKYSYDQDKKKLEKDNIGSFSQFPIKLAWAITIHKSQGKTFEKVILDLGRGSFSSGQTYVALSRCTTLEGLILKRPFKKGDVIIDCNVVKYMTSFQYEKSEKNMSFENKVILIEKAIEDQKSLKIIYLKANDQKSNREISPKSIGEQIYMNKKYVGIKAFCHKREENRIFKVDRILEIIN
jgi:ATP-dependent DNA helicase PIF1